MYAQTFSSTTKVASKTACMTTIIQQVRASGDIARHFTLSIRSSAPSSVSMADRACRTRRKNPTSSMRDPGKGFKSFMFPSAILQLIAAWLPPLITTLSLPENLPHRDSAAGDALA